MKAGWEKRKLGDVAEVIAGQSPEGSFYNNSGDGLPFYQGKKEFRERFIGPPTTWTSQITKVASKGDVLMSVRAPVGPVNFATEISCIGRGLAAIRNSDGLDRDFLFYFLLSKQGEINGNEGAVFPSINKAEIEQISIAVPPLPEQQRIVRILDKTFEGIATVKANAEKNLQNARAVFESYLEAVFTQRGEGWEEKKLEELGTITSSKRIHKSDYVKSGVPFYRTKEVKELANDSEITTELFISDLLYKEIKERFGVPKPGDILLTAIGTIGEVYVIEDDEEIYFKDGNVLWLKNFVNINSQFLKYVLVSYVESLNKLAHGAAYSALLIEQLNKHKIFVPPPSEQVKIVNKLDSLQAETHHLESIYQRKLNALDQLKKSLLHQAFNGEL
jgi:type I restriction enzyme S subunit